MENDNSTVANQKETHSENGGGNLPRSSPPGNRR